VLALLPLLFGAAAESGTDLSSGLISYGISAPFAIVCLGIARWAIKDRDKKVTEAYAERDAERARTEKLTDQLIQLQGTALPLLSEAAAVIRVTGGKVG
jgi:hypothetical protein